jgi:amino-acid N-acetyltransferase
VRRRLRRVALQEKPAPWFSPVRRRSRLREAVLDFTADAGAADLRDALARAWGVLRQRPLLVALVAESALVDFAQRFAARLRVHKLVLAEEAGGISSAAGEQISFMDVEMLTTILRAGEAEWAGLAARRTTLAAIRSALQQGVATVNLCTLDGLARELFTYEGSGTLFTREDYCKVERLGIDDFEEVERLLARGEREGYLKPRSDEETLGILLNGFGATIGAHHLAGVCGLETEAYARERAGEVVGLYTITRFKSEGVGGRLLARVLLEASELGLDYVFACTLEPRAQTFFERQGFRCVGRDEVPSSKWEGYDSSRLDRLKVYRREIDPAARREG